MTTPLVTTAWLADHLGDPDLVLIDASWYMPAANRSGEAEYLHSHLPGALFFGIDEIADHATDLPHMLPAPAEFARRVGAMGIADTDTIVVYDEAGIFSAPRAWWSFVIMGARDVRVLDGGGLQWRAEGRPTQSGPVARSPKTFTPRFNPALVQDFSAVLGLTTSAEKTIVDARPANRFQGEAPEPRPGLKSGHIPTSRNIPSSSLTVAGRMRPAAELAALARDAGVDLTRPIVTSCGSGVTAAALALALTIAGARDIAVYDGSWAEWGGRDDAPVER